MPFLIVRGDDNLFCTLTSINLSRKKLSMMDDRRPLVQLTNIVCFFQVEEKRVQWESFFLLKSSKLKVEKKMEVVSEIEK